MMRIHRSGSADIAAGEHRPGNRGGRRQEYFHLVVGQHVQHRADKRAVLDPTRPVGPCPA